VSKKKAITYISRICIYIYTYIYYTGTGFLPFRNRSSLGGPRTSRTPPGIRSGPRSWVRIKCSGHGNAGSLPATDGDSFLTWVLVQGHSWYHQRVLQMSLEGNEVRRKRTESLLVLHVGTCIVHYSIYIYISCLAICNRNVKNMFFTKLATRLSNSDARCLFTTLSWYCST